ncbi:hypothetical protein HN014_04285 [Aquimarina sp. TRL1]|uniref:hypothetical protein n=1 Tax=Aquimarina sp. (strain TRL1) TaxID=2736252 RepID=UPI00158D4C00|nr:hypothetical protein [Aquimarina sp. TRL1]QKX04157.1 hypothetical protein HN014_04285 [Aquimarina sp. TRL1]
MTASIILCIAMLNIACLLISKRKSIKWRFFLNGISLIIIASGLIYIKWFYPDSKTISKEYPLLHSQRSHKGLFDLNTPLLKATKVHTLYSLSGVQLTYKSEPPCLTQVHLSKKGIETNHLLLPDNKGGLAKLVVSYDHIKDSILQVRLNNTSISFSRLQQLLKENNLLPSNKTLYGLRLHKLFTATTAKRGNSPIDRGILTFIFAPEYKLINIFSSITQITLKNHLIM